MGRFFPTLLHGKQSWPKAWGGVGSHPQCSSPWAAVTGTVLAPGWEGGGDGRVRVVKKARPACGPAVK